MTNDDDLVGIEQLEAFAAAYPDFTFAMLRRGRRLAPIRKKAMSPRYIEPAHVNGGDVDVYLCGPPADGRCGARLAHRTGLRAGNFYYEKFSPSGAVTAIGETHRQAA